MLRLLKYSKAVVDVAIWPARQVLSQAERRAPAVECSDAYNLVGRLRQGLVHAEKGDAPRDAPSEHRGDAAWQRCRAHMRAGGRAMQEAVSPVTYLVAWVFGTRVPQNPLVPFDASSVGLVGLALAVTQQALQSVLGLLGQGVGGAIGAVVSPLAPKGQRTARFGQSVAAGRAAAHFMVRQPVWALLQVSAAVALLPALVVEAVGQAGGLLVGAVEAAREAGRARLPLVVARTEPETVPETVWPAGTSGAEHGPEALPSDRPDDAWHRQVLLRADPDGLAAVITPRDGALPYLVFRGAVSGGLDYAPLSGDSARGFWHHAQGDALSPTRKVYSDVNALLVSVREALHAEAERASAPARDPDAQESLALAARLSPLQADLIAEVAHYSRRHELGLLQAARLVSTLFADCPRVTTALAPLLSDGLAQPDVRRAAETLMGKLDAEPAHQLLLVPGDLGILGALERATDPPDTYRLHLIDRGSCSIYHDGFISPDGRKQRHVVDYESAALSRTATESFVRAWLELAAAKGDKAANARVVYDKVRMTHGLVGRPAMAMMNLVSASGGAECSPYKNLLAAVRMALGPQEYPAAKLRAELRLLKHVPHSAAHVQHLLALAHKAARQGHLPPGQLAAARLFLQHVKSPPAPAAKPEPAPAPSRARSDTFAPAPESAPAHAASGLGSGHGGERLMPPRAASVGCVEGIVPVPETARTGRAAPRAGHVAWRCIESYPARSLYADPGLWQSLAAARLPPNPSPAQVHTFVATRLQQVVTCEENGDLSAMRELIEQTTAQLPWPALGQEREQDGPEAFAGDVFANGNWRVLADLLDRYQCSVPVETYRLPSKGANYWDPSFEQPSRFASSHTAKLTALKLLLIVDHGARQELASTPLSDAILPWLRAASAVLGIDLDGYGEHSRRAIANLSEARLDREATAYVVELARRHRAVVRFSPRAHSWQQDLEQFVIGDFTRHGFNGSLYELANERSSAYVSRFPELARDLKHLLVKHKRFVPQRQDLVSPLVVMTDLLEAHPEHRPALEASQVVFRNFVRITRPHGARYDLSSQAMPPAWQKFFFEQYLDYNWATALKVMPRASGMSRLEYGHRGHVMYSRLDYGALSQAGLHHLLSRQLLSVRDLARLDSSAYNPVIRLGDLDEHERAFARMSFSPAHDTTLGDHLATEPAAFASLIALIERNMQLHAGRADWQEGPGAWIYLASLAAGVRALCPQLGRDPEKVPDPVKFLDERLLNMDPHSAAFPLVAAACASLAPLPDLSTLDAATNRARCVAFVAQSMRMASPLYIPLHERTTSRLSMQRRGMMRYLYPALRDDPRLVDMLQDLLVTHLQRNGFKVSPQPYDASTPLRLEFAGEGGDAWGVDLVTGRIERHREPWGAEEFYSRVPHGLAWAKQQEAYQRLFGPRHLDWTSNGVGWAADGYSLTLVEGDQVRITRAFACCPNVVMQYSPQCSALPPHLLADTPHHRWTACDRQTSARWEVVTDTDHQPLFAAKTSLDGIEEVTAFAGACAGLTLKRVGDALSEQGQYGKLASYTWQRQGRAARVELPAVPMNFVTRDDAQGLWSTWQEIRLRLQPRGTQGGGFPAWVKGLPHVLVYAEGCGDCVLVRLPGQSAWVLAAASGSKDLVGVTYADRLRLIGLYWNKGDLQAATPNIELPPPTNTVAPVTDATLGALSVAHMPAEFIGLKLKLLHRLMELQQIAQPASIMSDLCAALGAAIPEPWRLSAAQEEQLLTFIVNRSETLSREPLIQGQLQQLCQRLRYLRGDARVLPLAGCDIASARPPSVRDADLRQLIYGIEDQSRAATHRGERLDFEGALARLEGLRVARPEANEFLALAPALVGLAIGNDAAAQSRIRDRLRLMHPDADVRCHTLRVLLQATLQEPQVAADVLATLPAPDAEFSVCRRWNARVASWASAYFNPEAEPKQLAQEVAIRVPRLEAFLQHNNLPRLEVFTKVYIQLQDMLQDHRATSLEPRAILQAFLPLFPDMPEAMQTKFWSICDELHEAEQAGGLTPDRALQVCVRELADAVGLKDAPQQVRAVVDDLKHGRISVESLMSVANGALSLSAFSRLSSAFKSIASKRSLDLTDSWNLVRGVVALTPLGPALSSVTATVDAARWLMKHWHMIRAIYAAVPRLHRLAAAEQLDLAGVLNAMPELIEAVSGGQLSVADFRLGSVRSLGRREALALDHVEEIRIASSAMPSRPAHAASAAPVALVEAESSPLVAHLAPFWHWVQSPTGQARSAAPGWQLQDETDALATSTARQMGSILEAHRRGAGAPQRARRLRPDVNWKGLCGALQRFGESLDIAGLEAQALGLVHGDRSRQGSAQAQGQGRDSLTMVELLRLFAAGRAGLETLRASRGHLRPEDIPRLQTLLLNILLQRCLHKQMSQALTCVHDILHSDAASARHAAAKTQLETILGAGRCYDPQQAPWLLLLESQLGFFLREKQVHVLNDFLRRADESERHVLVQGIMGLGKTTAIMPIRAYLQAHDGISALLLPDPLWETLRGDYKKLLQDTFSQATVEFVCTGKSDLSIHKLRDLLGLLRSAKERGLCLLSTVRSWQFFHTEYLQSNIDLARFAATRGGEKLSPEMATWVAGAEERLGVMDEILATLKSSVHVNADEVDQPLNVLSEVSRTTGAPTSILPAVAEDIGELCAILAGHPELGWCANEQSLMRADDANKLMQDLAGDYVVAHPELLAPFEHAADATTLRAQLTTYLHDKTAEVPAWLASYAASEPAAPLLQRIGLLRGAFCQVLPVVLKRNYGMHYGASPDATVRYAIPYHQGETTEAVFHVLETAFWTMHMYNAQPSLLQADRLAQDLAAHRRQILRERRKFQYMASDAETEAFKFVRLYGPGLSDEEWEALLQSPIDHPKLGEVLQHLRDNHEDRNRYLSRHVLPEIPIYNDSVRSTAHNWTGMFKQTQGLSATPWDHETYPSQFVTVHDPSVDGAMLNVALGDKTGVFQMPQSLDPCDLVRDFRRAHPHAKLEMLVDEGGIFKKSHRSNLAVARGIARALLGEGAATSIKSYVYFDDASNRPMFLRDGVTRPLTDLSPASLDAAGLTPGTYFAYCDAKHARGSNFVLSPDACALMCISELSTWYSAGQQGAGRLRQLVTGQQRIWWAYPPAMQGMLAQPGAEVTVRDCLDLMVKNQSGELSVRKVKSIREKADHVVESAALQALMSAAPGAKCKLANCLLPLLKQSTGLDLFAQYGRDSEGDTEAYLLRGISQRVARLTEVIDALPKDYDAARDILTRARDTLAAPAVIMNLAPNIGPLPSRIMGAGIDAGCEQIRESTTHRETEVEQETETELELELERERERQVYEHRAATQKSKPIELRLEDYRSFVPSDYKIGWLGGRNKLYAFADLFETAGAVDGNLYVTFNALVDAQQPLWSPGTHALGTRSQQPMRFFLEHECADGTRRYFVVSPEDAEALLQARSIHGPDRQAPKVVLRTLPEGRVAATLSGTPAAADGVPSAECMRAMVNMKLIDSLVTHSLEIPAKGPERDALQAWRQNDSEEVASARMDLLHGCIAIKKTLPTGAPRR